jgi:hypothetical protein
MILPASNTGRSHVQRHVRQRHVRGGGERWAVQILLAVSLEDGDLLSAVLSEFVGKCDHCAHNVIALIATQCVCTRILPAHAGAVRRSADT